MNSAPEPLFGQFHSIPGHPRETDLQRVSFGPHGLHLNGLSRRLRGDHDGLRRKVERYPQYIRVLNVEQAVFIEIVGLPAQRAADDLLAEQLCAEGANAQHVADGVRIPPFGKHRHRHHAANRIPQPTRLAYGVHDLAEQSRVADVLGLAGVAGAFDDLSPKAFDLVRGHVAEVLVQRVAGLQLLAVDQQRAGPRVRVAMLVEVAEQFETPDFERRRAIVVLAVEAGDKVVDQLGGRRVVADHDEARRHVNARLLHEIEGLGVVAVEGLQGGLELHGQAEGIEVLCLAPPLLRHVGADVLPEISELGHIAAGDVVGHRHAGQLDDAAFDGVHEREVAHRPVEQRAFGVARPAQKERRRGEIHHPADPKLSDNGFDPRNPQPGGFSVLFGFLPVVAFEFAFLLLARLLAVAVVRLIVEDQDVLHAHELGHDPLQHLSLGLQGRERLASSLEQGTAALGELQALAQLEGVVVGDDDLRLFQIGEHVARDQLAASVVAVRIVRLQHAQAVLDGDAGRDHQEAARESAALRPADRVDGLPGDQHRHDGGLSGAGRQLERQPGEVRVGVVVGVRQMVEEILADPARARRHLDEPDGGLYRLDLAEEGPNAAEPVVPPVLEQAGRLRGHLPLARVWVCFATGRPAGEPR